MHLHRRLEVRAADEPIQSHISLTLRGALRRGDIFHAVHHHERVSVAPCQRAVLYARNIKRETLDLVLRVTVVDQIAHVKHLCTAVNLRPKTLLDGLLVVLQFFALLCTIQVGEHAHHLGHTMQLQQVQELKGLHFVTKRCVDQNKNQVGNLCQVSHSVDVV